MTTLSKSICITFVLCVFTTACDTSAHTLRAADRAAPKPAIVKLVPPKKTEYWMGQRIDFAFDLLVLGQFSGTAQFDIPQVPGVVVIKSADRPTLLSEEVDEETYVVQRHEFSLYSQREGSCTFPALTVRIGAKAAFDKPVTQHRLKTEPVKVTTRLPPDAKPGETVVSTSKLSLSEIWNPRPGAAQEGDGFTRTVTIECADIPGMLLPPFPETSIEGLTIYPKQPQVQNKSNRGELIGHRTESLTYMCNKSGEYEIPEHVVHWWDISKETWKTEKLESVRLAVKPNPHHATKPSTEQQTGEISASQKPRLAFAMVLALASILLLLVWRWGIPAWRTHREVWRKSPAGYFARVKRACLANDPPAADRAILEWLVTNKTSLQAIACGLFDERLLWKEYAILQEALIGRGLPWNGKALLRCLVDAQNSLIDKEQIEYREMLVPTINPKREST